MGAVNLSRIYLLSFYLLFTGIVKCDKQDGIIDGENDSGMDTKTKAFIVCGVLVVVALVLLIALIIVCRRYLSHDGKYGVTRSSEKEALCRQEETQMSMTREFHGYSQPHVECGTPVANKHADNGEVMATVHMQPNDNCLLNRKPQSNGGVAYTSNHGSYFDKPNGGSGPYYSKPSDSNGYNPYSSYSSIPPNPDEPLEQNGSVPTLELCENDAKRPSNLYEPVDIQINSVPDEDSQRVRDNNAVNDIKSARDSDHYIVGNDEYAIIRKDRKSRTSETSCESPRCNSAYDNVMVYPEQLDNNHDADCHNSSTDKILPLPKRCYRNSDLLMTDWATKQDTAV